MRDIQVISKGVLLNTTQERTGQPNTKLLLSSFITKHIELGQTQKDGGVT